MENTGHHITTVDTDPFYDRRPGDILVAAYTQREYEVVALGRDVVGAPYYQVRRHGRPDEGAVWITAQAFMRN